MKKIERLTRIEKIELRRRKQIGTWRIRKMKDFINAITPYLKNLPDYKIEFITGELRTPKGDVANGYYNWDTETIFIANNNFDKDGYDKYIYELLVVCTLCHEHAHFILNHKGIPLNDEISNTEIAEFSADYGGLCISKYLYSSCKNIAYHQELMLGLYENMDKSLKEKLMKQIDEVMKSIFEQEIIEA